MRMKPKRKCKGYDLASEWWVRPTLEWAIQEAEALVAETQKQRKAFDEAERSRIRNQVAEQMPTPTEIKRMSYHEWIKHCVRVRQRCRVNSNKRRNDPANLPRKSGGY